MLIAEDLLLLLLDDTKRSNRTSFMRPALGGALLVELAMGEYVEVGPKRWSGARVSAVATARTPDDPLLAEALTTISAKPRTAQDLVNRLGRKSQRQLADRLVAAGVLEHRRTRLLGIFPVDRWPARTSLREDGVRRGLEAVLVAGAEPDERQAALIALLHAVDRAHRSIDLGGRPAREVKRRAKAIAEGNWAAKGVRDAVQAAMAATTAAAAGGAVAASSS